MTTDLRLGLPPLAGFEPVDLRSVSVLVVEDDEGDAVFLAAALEEAGVEASAVRWATTLAGGLAVARDVAVDCALVDLGLPDASGLEAVRGMVEHVDAAVIVLTGLYGTSGQPALAAGAQDYLIKDGLQPDALSRAIRYAVERKRVERTSRALDEARLRSRENARLERGLLPRPILDSGRLASATTYRAGRDHTLLGGDFYDIVQRPDGSVRVVIGDVMGHGPDEAALGVHLRAAWRSLVLAGIADSDLVHDLDRFLTAEAAPGGPFVTVCDLTVHADLQALTVRSAGHPAPVLTDRDGTRLVDVPTMPPLGIGALGPTLDTTVALQGPWRVLLFTDGLLDSFRDAEDLTDIGVAGLLAACAPAPGPADIEDWVAGVIARGRRAVTDDMAVVAVGPAGDRLRG